MQGSVFPALPFFLCFSPSLSPTTSLWPKRRFQAASFQALIGMRILKTGNRVAERQHIASGPLWGDMGLVIKISTIGDRPSEHMP